MEAFVGKAWGGTHTGWPVYPWCLQSHIVPLWNGWPYHITPMFLTMAHTSYVNSTILSECSWHLRLGFSVSEFFGADEHFYPCQTHASLAEGRVKWWKVDRDCMNRMKGPVIFNLETVVWSRIPLGEKLSLHQFVWAWSTDSTGGLWTRCDGALKMPRNWG